MLIIKSIKYLLRTLSTPYLVKPFSIKHPVFKPPKTLLMNDEYL